MFALFRRRKSDAPRPRAGCFGKIPAFGDFLRRHAADAAFRDFDRRLAEGLLASQRRLGELFPALYDRTPPTRILHLPPAPAPPLAAYCIASSDKVGRRYPFTVFSRIETTGAERSAASLLTALEPFFTRARHLAASVHNGLSRQAIFERLDRLAFGEASRPRHDALDQWLASRTDDELYREAFGGGRQERGRRILERLARRLSAPPRPAVVVKLPPCRRAGDAGFWLAAVERLAGEGWPPRLVLWGEDLPGAPPALTVVLGTSSRGNLTLLFDPLPEGPGVLDVSLEADPVSRPGAEILPSSGGNPHALLEVLAMLSDASAPSFSRVA